MDLLVAPAAMEKGDIELLTNPFFGVFLQRVSEFPFFTGDFDPRLRGVESTSGIEVEEGLGLLSESSRCLDSRAPILIYSLHLNRLIGA